MKFVSILNDVLGPVMRGPSSSHTAGSFHIGKTVRSLLGDEPRAAVFTFDPSGSYAQTCRQQAADLALASGIMGWSITDHRFVKALEIAKRSGLKIGFKTAPLDGAIHPNTVKIQVISKKGKKFDATALSTGGGGFTIVAIEGWPVKINGHSHEIIILADRKAETRIKKVMTSESGLQKSASRQVKGAGLLLTFHLDEPFPPEIKARLESQAGVKKVWISEPVFLARKGAPLFTSAQEMVRAAEKRACSLGEMALEYEATLLGLSKEDVLDEIRLRFEVMKKSVADGLHARGVAMLLLPPSAGSLFRAEASGKAAIGGLHTRAAARAMAVMHVANSRGVVCAAPTGGAAGTLPGVVVTLAEEKGPGERKIALMLLAAGAVGLIIARRATFAAEIAGCQVEIGAAGAMAAAAVVEFGGGSPRQAADAAAISLQNTMGSVCDLVQGLCEIPCHTRNAVAASGAFVCADIVLGGYRNPVPLDETIDAVYDTGKKLPSELRCTARGGIALAPSARSLPRRRSF